MQQSLSVYLTLQKYQKDYAAYEEKRKKFLDWEDENRSSNAIASRNFANTDEALNYYNRMHEDEHLASEPPQFGDYYKPSKVTCSSAWSCR